MMMRRKESWIESKEALEILSKQSGHNVSRGYLGALAHSGKIRYRAKDGRTNEYYRADVEAYKVKTFKPRKSKVSKLEEEK